MGEVSQTTGLDALLAPWRERLGGDYPGYRNHCHRLLRLCTALVRPEPDDAEKIAVAAAFHDLGIWTQDSLDYLEPSQQLARDYLAARGWADWADEVAAMIGWHHKLTAYRGPGARLVEAFRQADWIDVSLGLRRFGLPSAIIADIRAAFPNAGFHRLLLRLTLREARRHPLRPLPIFKL